MVPSSLVPPRIKISRFLLFFSSCLIINTYSQKADTVEKNRDCQQKEITEILFKKNMDRPPDTLRKLNVFLLPYIAYNPTKGFQLGAGGTLSWYMGKSFSTNQSAASASAEFTTERQQLYQLKSNIYTDENKWFLQGDWRFYIYSIPTYGLGTGYGNPVPVLPGMQNDTLAPSEWNQSFRVKYRWLKIHEIFSYRLAANLYAGIGYHFDLHYQINDEELNQDSTPYVITPHYAYSTLYGFNPKQYTSSGLSVNFVYDTRDNMINAYKGYFVHVNYRLNQTWFGSDKSGSQLWAEFRTYVNLEKKFPRHLIAFWLYGGFQVSGVIPYFDLWATGFDQMNSSGRGYLQGRWRGENLMYGEAEYRFPISRCSQVLGGVLFVNATTASSKDQGVHLFDYIRPAGGFGLRIMVSKVNRTNILIDFTIGEKSKGIYFSAQEAF
jgi:outer membrane protein assembly factor BamA